MSLVAGPSGEIFQRRGLFKDDDEDKEPTTDFDLKETEEKLKTSDKEGKTQSENPGDKF